VGSGNGGGGGGGGGGSGGGRGSDGNDRMWVKKDDLQAGEEGIVVFHRFQCAVRVLLRDIGVLLVC